MPWYWLFPEKFIVIHLVKKFPAFMELKILSNVFTKACHWTLY
jgi:hypothetical protein